MEHPILVFLEEWKTAIWVLLASLFVAGIWGIAWGVLGVKKEIPKIGREGAIIRISERAHRVRK